MNQSHLSSRRRVAKPTTWKPRITIREGQAAVKHKHALIRSRTIDSNQYHASSGAPAAKKNHKRKYSVAQAGSTHLVVLDVAQSTGLEKQRENHGKLQHKHLIASTRKGLAGAFVNLPLACAFTCNSCQPSTFALALRVRKAEGSRPPG